MKGFLQMRSSVLCWYWQISWKATIPDWYFQGLFNPHWRTLYGGLPPMVGLMQPVSWLDIKGPTSAAILASAWVEGDPGNFPHSLQPLQLLPPLLHLSQGRRCTCRGYHWLETLPLAHPGCFFHPCHLKWSSNQAQLWQAFLELCTVFSFYCRMASYCGLVEMAEKWDEIAHILEREGREFKEVMKWQVGTTSSSSNNSKKMGSSKKCLLEPVLSSSMQTQNFRLCLPPSSCHFHWDSLIVLSSLYLGAGPMPWLSGGCLNPVWKGRGAHSQ